jgi:hypothetical protein
VVFGDDALEVLPAYLRKELAAIAVDMLRVEDRARALGHNRARELLSPDER